MIYLITVTYFGKYNLEVLGTTNNYEDALVEISRHFTNLICDFGEENVIFWEPIYSISAYERKFIELVTYDNYSFDEYVIVDGPAW